MAPKLKFAEGEKVLCFHGPLIYEAKCLKSLVSKEKHIKYLIHYAGWNKNWDEWVPESRVLKYNEANVQKQKEVQKAHSSQPAKSKKSTGKGRKSESSGTSTPTTAGASGAVASTSSKQTDTPATGKEKDKDGKDKDGKDKEKDAKEKVADKDKDTESRASTPHQDTVSQDSGSDVPRKKRGRLDLSVESEEQFLNKVEVRIKVPEELKTWLVDDWDIITRQQKLVNLPAKLTVFQILDNYLAHKKTSKVHNNQKEAVLTDFTEGVKEYFNTTLGSQLLYKFERPQYSEILQGYPDTPMSKIYGAIHLLRLTVKIGPMLAYTSLDEKSLQHTVSHIHDLLKYMVSNRASLFSLQDYGNATPEYHRKVQ